MTVTRTSASWTNAAGAALHGVEDRLRLDRSPQHHELRRHEQRHDAPEVSLPSGSLSAKVQALVGDLDLSDLAIDRDREKLTAVGAANV